MRESRNAEAGTPETDRREQTGTFQKMLNEQLDFICTDCPLKDCDEESLFCAYRWALNPNAAQRKLAVVVAIGRPKTGAERAKLWRQRNPEKYEQVRRNYRQRKRESRLGTATSER